MSDDFMALGESGKAQTYHEEALRMDNKLNSYKEN